MQRLIKQSFLLCSKWLGMFHLARRSTAGGLRILCYHGFAVADEGRFRPQLFISPATFRRRLDTIVGHGFPVLELGDAIHRLKNGTLPSCATVITIDDGFWGVYRGAISDLLSRGLPATVYVTTYYVVKEKPVFRLVVQYLFWKTKRSRVEFRGRPWIADSTVDLRDDGEIDRAVVQVIEHGIRCTSEEERQAIARELAEALDVDYGQVESSRAFSLMNVDEVRELAAEGIDIQLHTHRHPVPVESAEQTKKEIGDNRRVLEPLVEGRLEHFCYPSGSWGRHQWPWLQREGIASATTCDRGLNYQDTPVLGLKRMVDGEDITQTVFESELFGYNELLRRARSAIRNLFRGSRRVAADGSG